MRFVITEKAYCRAMIYKQATRGKHAAGSQPTRGGDELTASDGRGRNMKSERVALEDDKRNTCHSG